MNKRRQILRLPPKHASTDTAQAADSIKELSRLDFDILCLGHGRPLTDNASSRVQELLGRIRIDNPS